MKKQEFLQNLEKLAMNQSADIKMNDLSLIMEFTEESDHREIITDSIDSEWKERLKSQWWATNYSGDVRRLVNEIPDYSKIVQLRERLLKIGGEEVCIPFVEEDINQILEYGQFWTHSPKLMKGEPSQCHYNSCCLWNNNKKNTLIATGYALSKDGMWRQHSWVIHIKLRSNQVIETTVPRIAYYGYVMNFKMCEDFYENNR